MARNFDFVKRFAPDIVSLLNAADMQCYAICDHQACIMKVGAAIETLVCKHLFNLEGITLLSYRDDEFTDYITALEKKGSCPKNVITKLKYIRKKRNEAAHDNRATGYDAKVTLKEAHKVLVWCCKYYIGIEVPAYCEPNIIAIKSIRQAIREMVYGTPELASL